MLPQKRIFRILVVVMVVLTGLLYSIYIDRLWLADVITTAQYSTAAFAQSLYGNNRSHIVRSNTLDTPTYKIHNMEMFLNKEYLTEEEALKDGPLTDVRKTVSVARSSVSLKGNRRMFNTGENIELHIILRDGNGKDRTRGGDKLRVRMFNTTQQAFVAGHVTDHDNGSYTATVPALWSGNQNISVFLAYTREAVRAIYYIRKKIQGTRIIGAVFMNGSHREDTSCHAERRWLIQYLDVCNLTRDNGGMSWYCGKPQHKRISCQDWSFSKYVTPYPKLPLTKAEEEMFKPKWDQFPDLEVEVTGTVHEMNNLQSCYSYPRQLLWNKSEPTGFFYNNKWILLHCQQPNTSVYRPCLQGKHLMISGDSTSRQWYSFLRKNMQCEQISEKWTTEKWHRKSKCIVPSLNFTIEWIPHAQPFFPGEQWDLHKFAVNCIAKDIDEIGDKQNIIFVIHMHMHFTAFHHSIFHDRMRHISNSVRNILQKNKHVIFMIKGPHTYKIPGLRGNRLDDYFGYVYKDIMYNEFEGLHDKIVFLNQADMTTAKGLVQNHPPEDVVKEAVFQMFDYTCKKPSNSM